MDITEELALATTPKPAPELTGELCRSCGAPLAPDQRYCLECGTRRTETAVGLEQLRERRQASAVSTAQGEAYASRTSSIWSANTAALVGVACLLLAMGVGVLIGRAGRSVRQVGAAPPQVINVTGGGSTGASAAAPTVKDDWPAGKTGYTIQLQTLPTAGTQQSAVDAAKSAASSKGATGVGALKSDDHGLTAGSYIIYSGVYDQSTQADQALKQLASKFPGAKVIKVAAAGGGSTPVSSSGGGGSSNPAPSNSKPAPQVKQLQGLNGTDYVKQSKKLPKTVSTGGAPPPTDNKPAASGGSFQNIGP
jgi:hypothetical protein